MGGSGGKTASGRTSTPPLSKVAVGLLLVVVDFRVDGLDVLADPVGWLVIASGLSALGLSSAKLAAIAAAGLSIVDLTLPTTLVRSDVQGWSDGQGNSSWSYTETSEVLVEGWRAIGVSLYHAGTCAALWVALLGLERLADSRGSRRSAERFRSIRRLTVTAMAVGLAAETEWVAGDSLAAPAFAAAIVGFAGVAWLIWTLHRQARAPWASPTMQLRPAA